MAFQVGSEVRLKSGGPVMTVEGPVTDVVGNPTGDLHCTWFDSKRVVQSDVFHPEMLEDASDKEGEDFNG